MSKIQWTDSTANPITVATGGHWCHKISEGCANCYAETINTGNRFDFASGLKYGGSAPALKFDYSIPESWARKRKPHRTFVCSMTDLFGSWVERDWQFAIFDGAVAAPLQTIQVLTKRPEIARDAAIAWCESRDRQCLPPNLWMGVTCETRRTAQERIPVLLEIPAWLRFLSCEPLLEEVTIPHDILSQIDWVIVGGESGTGARSCDVGWLESLRGQCAGIHTSLFVKQLGSRPTYKGRPVKVKGKGGDPDTLAHFGLNIRQMPMDAITA